MSIIRRESGLHVPKPAETPIAPEQVEGVRVWFAAMLRSEYDRIHRNTSVLVQRIPGSGPTILQLAGRRVPYHGPRMTIALESASRNP